MTYKQNSLGNLEAWLNDALNSDATSKEVYDSIIMTVKDEIEYHKRCLKRSEDLLVMLKGNLSALYDTDPWNPVKGDEPFEETLEREGYEYTPQVLTMLSKQTLEPLEEAQGCIRTALKSAAINEKPIVVHQLSKLLMDIEQCKDFEHIMDIMEQHAES